MQSTAEALALEEGDLALIVAAGAKPRAYAALAALRVAMAREYGLLREKEAHALWVTDFPLRVERRPLRVAGPPSITPSRVRAPTKSTSWTATPEQSVRTPTTWS